MLREFLRHLGKWHSELKDIPAKHISTTDEAIKLIYDKLRKTFDARKEKRQKLTPKAEADSEYDPDDPNNTSFKKRRAPAEKVGPPNRLAVKGTPTGKTAGEDDKDMSDDSKDSPSALEEEDVSFSSISVSEAQTMDPFQAQKAKLAKVLDEVANDPETDSASRRISSGGLKIYISIMKDPVQMK